MDEIDRPQGSMKSDTDRGEGPPKLEVSMSRNTLLVNGEVLGADASPEVVLRALTEGKEQILSGLEKYREEMQSQRPGAEVLIAPFTVVDLGDMEAGNLSKSGSIQARGEQVIRTPVVLSADLIPLWETIENSGFVPSVRALYQHPGYRIGLWAELPAEE